jgi:signal transduction histidine kinase
VAVADYLDHVRRLCSFLFVIAVALVFVVIHLPESRVVDRTPIYTLLSLAFLTGLVVYWFPWRRYHPNWFLVIGVLATAMTSVLIAFSGGRQSVFYPIFFFIIVAAGTYYSAVPLALLTLIVSAGSISYVLYQAPSAADRLQSAFEIPTYFVVAFLCHLIYHHLERSVAETASAEAQRRLTELREDFVDQASHELRTPLTGVVAASELLARHDLPPGRQAEVIGYVQRSAIRLKQIVDDLLQLARIEQGKAPLELAAVQLPDLLRDVVDAFSSPGRASRVHLHVQGNIPTIQADPHRMRDVFSNLLANALKYSPEEAPVDVVCEDGARSVVVRVADRGLGIPPDSLPHIFDRFYRAPNIKDLAASGSGLGLTITRQLVEAHGGQVRAESKGEGQGSTFIVTLPIGTSD